jgi:hypothetical protein
LDRSCFPHKHEERGLECIVYVVRITEETATGSQHERPVPRYERGECRFRRHAIALLVPRKQFGVGQGDKRTAAPECREITKDALSVSSGHRPEFLGMLSHHYNAANATRLAGKMPTIPFFLHDAVRPRPPLGARSRIWNASPPHPAGQHAQLRLGVLSDSDAKHRFLVRRHPLQGCDTVAKFGDRR